MPGAPLSRREFLCRALCGGTALTGAGAALSSGALIDLALPEAAGAGVSLASILEQAPVARYWIAANAAGVDCASCHGRDAPAGEKYRHADAVVQCLLCPNRCVLAEGERGRCRARMNVNGELRTLVYGRPISEHVDPIEKKPFYHFLPGSQAYSLATSGCPLRCKFCQNWQIAQARPEDYRTPFLSPATMGTRVEQAGDAPIVAFTYNEPAVFAEYLIDIAKAVREQGRKTVLVSSGYVNEAPLADMLEVLDAIKIDLKGYDPEFYRKVAQGELEPVLRSIKQAARSGRHLELVNLVVPTLNDSEQQLTELSQWVVGELGPDVPVHFTRFHPDYQLRNLPPTPIATLERARAIAMEAGVHYAFVGNVPGHPGNHTYCPTCHQVVIQRSGFFVTATRLQDGCCTRCGTKIAGVWS